MTNQEAAPSPRESRDHVAEVARAALAQAAGDGKAAPELVQAIADGRGERGRVAGLARQLGGDGKPLELVLFDTDRIASYVFESSRPPVLAGASRILRDLNLEIDARHSRQVIYSGGGEGLLLVPRGQGAAVCAEIEGRFREATAGALAVTADHLPVSPEDLLADAGEASAADGIRLVSGTQSVLSRLRDSVRERKDGRLPARASVAGESARCVSCRDRQAGETDCPRRGLDDQPEGKLCEPCRLRWERGRRLIAGNSFEDIVERFVEARGTAGGTGARVRYLGLLYADGNGMGQLFGRLGSLAELRFASTAVARVFDETRERVEEEVGQVAPEILLSLLGGGDEAIWILPGALAVRAAERLAAWVDAAAAAIPGLLPLLTAAGVSRLTFGAGLVLCDLGFPVRYQHALASALLKSAKAMFQGAAARRDAVSSIDFAVLTDSSPLSEDLPSARALAYATDDPGFVRTCRPYTCESFADLLATARRTRQARLGKSQLYGLQTGATEGLKVFRNHLRYQIARKPAGPRYQAWMGHGGLPDRDEIDRFFLRGVDGGGAKGTWIPDMLELMPFLGLLEDGGED